MGLVTDFLAGMGGSTPTTKDSSSPVYKAERELLLRRILEVERALNEARVNNDGAALRVFQEQARAWRDTRKINADLLAQATKADGRMDVERLRAKAADIRNLRDNYGKLFAAFGQRGAAIYNRIVGSVAGVVGVDDRGRQEMVEKELARSLDPSDPASYEALSRAQSASGAFVTPEAQAAYARASAAWKDANDSFTGAQATLENFGRDPNSVTGEQVKTALETLDQQFGVQAPSMSRARIEVGEGAVPELEARIRELETGLDDTGSDLLGSRAPRPEELGTLAARPSYQKWAADRGFELGYVADSGAYVPGKDDLRAYWRAWRESTNRPVLGRDRLLEEVSVEALKPGARRKPLVAALESDPETGIASSALVRDPTGDLYRVDVASGERVLLQNEAGEWQSPQMKLDYEPKLDQLSHLDDEKGNPIGLENIGLLNSPDIVSGDFLLTPGDSPTMLVGRRIMTRAGDDPERTQRIAVQEGASTYEVELKRADAQSPWVEVSRREAPRYNFARFPARPAAPVGENILVTPAPVPELGGKLLDKADPAADIREAPPQKPAPEVLPPAVLNTPAPRVDSRGKPAAALPPERAAEPTGVPIPLPKASPVVANPITRGLATEPEDARAQRRIDAISSDGLVTGLSADAREAQAKVAIEQARNAVDMTRDPAPAAPVAPAAPAAPVAPTTPPARGLRGLLRRFIGR